MNFSLPRIWWKNRAFHVSSDVDEDSPAFTQLGALGVGLTFFACVTYPFSLCRRTRGVTVRREKAAAFLSVLCALLRPEGRGRLLPRRALSERPPETGVVGTLCFGKFVSLNLEKEISYLFFVFLVPSF